MRSLRLCLLSCLASLLASPGLAAASAPGGCPALLYGTDFDGTVFGGSKAALIEAVSRGDDIRVGWTLDVDEDGAGDLSHWAPATVLTIWEDEVFTQVPDIHRQRPVRGEADIRLPDGAQVWRGLLSSKGTLKGAFSRGPAFEERTVRIVWCAARPILPGWTLVYRNGTRGEPLAGSKSALFSAIRAGRPIQIAWGLGRESDGVRRSVEHLAVPVFLTITDEDHVVAQLPEHVAPKSYWGADSALFDDPAVLWRGLLSTTGSFDAIWSNRAAGALVRRSPQRAVLSWFAQDPPARTTPSLAVPDGVIRDAARIGERFPKP